MSEHEWKFSKAGAGCCICNTTFARQQPYFSALLTLPEPPAVETPADTPDEARKKDSPGFERRDYCENCFSNSRPAEVYYFWKTQLPAEDSEDRKAWKQRPVIDLEYVLEFFKRLEGDGAPQRQAFRYILALMLARKKVLLPEGRSTDTSGTTQQTFAERRGGQKHTVVEPSLNEEEIASVSAELGVLLGIAPAPVPQAQPAAAGAEPTAAEQPAPEATT